jgi:hypothetical protein
LQVSCVRPESFYWKEPFRDEQELRAKVATSQLERKVVSQVFLSATRRDLALGAYGRQEGTIRAAFFFLGGDLVPSH